MKIRNGFVSNSSSSSFVVMIKEEHPALRTGKDAFLADSRDVKKLKNFGFQESNAISPFDINQDLTFEGYDGPLSMHYYVTCNQDEVIYFLVKNNIPFKASCHYDHYFVSYQKDTDYILEAYNFGQEICMYGEDSYSFQHMKDTPAFKKIDKKKWLESEKSMWEDVDG